MTYLEKVHQDSNGQLSWMRVACSVALLTGVLAIFIQLGISCAVIFCTDKGMEELQHVEWMQPIALIGIAMTGKTAQKKIETDGKSE
jgi:hypothetical protein